MRAAQMNTSWKRIEGLQKVNKLDGEGLLNHYHFWGEEKQGKQFGKMGNGDGMKYRFRQMMRK